MGNITPTRAVGPHASRTARAARRAAEGHVLATLRSVSGPRWSGHVRIDPARAQRPAKARRLSEAAQQAADLADAFGRFAEACGAFGDSLAHKRPMLKVVR